MNRNMKTVFPFFLALVLSCLFLSCAKEGTEPSPTPFPMPSSAAVEFVQNLKIGWNLGNALDATGGSGIADWETSWGNPKTTKAMIDAVKAAGFNTIRVPTTWYPRMGAAPDCTVNGEWMDRVQEVVDYAIDDGMYVILNAHHENSWTYPTSANQLVATAKLKSLWTQIATRFADYDDHLIFEGLNEPRVENSPSAWSGGTAEYRAVINAYNQAFVDTIRSTGGNNPTRYLMVPPHAASGSSTALSDFTVPTDTASPSRIIVSIHNYSPYNFCLNGGTGATSSWGSASDIAALKREFDGYYDRFVANGIPVVIGEFGATNRNNEPFPAIPITYCR